MSTIPEMCPAISEAVDSVISAVRKAQRAAKGAAVTYEAVARHCSALDGMTVAAALGEAVRLGRVRVTARKFWIGKVV